MNMIDKIKKWFTEPIRPVAELHIVFSKATCIMTIKVGTTAMPGRYRFVARHNDYQQSQRFIENDIRTMLCEASHFINSGIDSGTFFIDLNNPYISYAKGWCQKPAKQIYNRWLSSDTTLDLRGKERHYTLNITDIVSQSEEVVGLSAFILGVHSGHIK